VFQFTVIFCKSVVVFQSSIVTLINSSSVNPNGRPYEFSSFVSIWFHNGRPYTLCISIRDSHTSGFGVCLTLTLTFQTMTLMTLTWRRCATSPQVSSSCAALQSSLATNYALCTEASNRWGCRQFSHWFIKFTINTEVVMLCAGLSHSTDNTMCETWDFEQD